MSKIITNKGKSKGYSYRNVNYDSKEEIYFKWFLDDLKEAGYVRNFSFHPETMEVIEKKEYTWIKELKIKRNKKKSTFISSLSYTADFEITWNKKAIKKFLYLIDKETSPKGSADANPFFIQPNESGALTSLIDVKGAYSQHGDGVKFPVIQKIVLEMTGIYVQKIVPIKLFISTFYPKRYLMTDGGTRKRKL